jgi:hypothetical protein
VGLQNQVTKKDLEQVRREWEGLGNSISELCFFAFVLGFRHNHFFVFLPFTETNPAISSFLESLDRELLLVLRSGNILRSINVALGGMCNERYR